MVADHSHNTRALHRVAPPRRSFDDMRRRLLRSSATRGEARGTPGGGCRNPWLPSHDIGGVRRRLAPHPLERVRREHRRVVTCRIDKRHGCPRSETLAAAEAGVCPPCVRAGDRARSRESSRTFAKEVPRDFRRFARILALRSEPFSRLFADCQTERPRSDAARS